MKEEIGGYFELELSKAEPFWPLLGQSIHLNSGRHALEYILRSLKKVDCVYLPFYTCDSVFEPFKRLAIPFKFYHVNDKLEIAEEINLGVNDYIIINNYFGVKDSYVNTMFSKYGNHMILDATQSLYFRPKLGLKAFYSPRKFVGVPDGGFAVTTSAVDFEIPQGYSYDKCDSLLKRLDKNASLGYSDFKSASQNISQENMSSMSKLTSALIQSIDFDFIGIKRRTNFDILHSALSSTNQLQLPFSETLSCPMVYPYRTEGETLRKRLIENKVFVATYWPNVVENKMLNPVEAKLATEIIPLPIDQRYGEEEMNRIIKLI